MDKLFLLKPGFRDSKSDKGKSYYCPPCTLFEGVLSFYPILREKLEVNYVDYVRPRPAIIELIGEDNQSCPVLIKPDGTFINNPDFILHYLADTYGIGYPH